MTVGIIANPVSGRDIRRVAARGGISSAEDKRNRIARAVIGAVAGGATHIVAMKEPFGIASGALADLPVEAELEILDIGARVDPADTTRAALAMRDRGINVVITLGGDGTNRTIARVWPDVTLVPMSTGTNNVFPSLVEPTVAGAAAGLVATGKTDENEVAPKSKLIHWLWLMVLRTSRLLMLQRSPTILLETVCLLTQTTCVSCLFLRQGQTR